MCFLLEMNTRQEVFYLELLLGLFISISIYNSIHQMNLSLGDLVAKYDNNKASHEESMKILKKTVERLKEDMRELEEAVKKALKEFRLYKTDKTGLVDYAYRGRVTVAAGTATYDSEGVSLFGMPVCGQSYLEGRIVEPSVMPGDCWPIKGQKGSATIELIDEINISRVSLEHALKELLPNGTSSAPKEFSLLGISSRDSSGEPAHFFGRFAYSVDSAEVQTFTVQNASPKYFKRVEVQIHSNHGNSQFTCVYRVRIHGTRGNEYQQV